MNNINSERAIYIAGPMTGRSGYGYEEFCRAVQYWKKRRYAFGIVVNPCDYVVAIGSTFVTKPAMNDYLLFVACFRAIEKAPDVLAKTIAKEEAALRQCSAIYLLRGWEHSTGTRRELAIALELGLEIILEEAR